MLVFQKGRIRLRIRGSTRLPEQIFPIIPALILAFNAAGGQDWCRSEMVFETLLPEMLSPFISLCKAGLRSTLLFIAL